jgi:hypothetical protein
MSCRPLCSPSMRRRTSSIVLVSATLLAACGGSGSSATSSSSPSATPTTASSSTAASSLTAQSTSTTATAAAQASASSTSSAQSSAARAPDTNVRLPAAFTIEAGGALQPPEIAAPKHTDIDLTVRSGDGHEHELVLETPHRYHATVRPGAPAKLLLKELPDGSYGIEVDHVVRGRLIVGVAPGP